VGSKNFSGSGKKVGLGIRYYIAGVFAGYEGMKFHVRVTFTAQFTPKLAHFTPIDIRRLKRVMSRLKFKTRQPRNPYFSE
jgi:hypothetical protein